MSAVAAQAVRGEGVVGLTVPGNAVLPSVFVSFDPASPPLSLPSDLLLLAVFDSALSRDDTSAANFTGFAADAPGGAELASLDATLSGALAELASDPDFRAKPGQVSQVLRVPGQPFKRIALVGLGKPDVLLKGEAGSWQGVGSAIAGAAKTNQASKVSVAFVGKPEAAVGQEIKAGSAVRGIVTGALVGSFEDVRFKSEEKEKAKAERGVKELQVVGLGDAESLQRDVFEAERLAAGIILTKQLVNAPPNVLTPAVLADVAVNLTAAHADVLSARILEKDECAALGMGSYLAVAEASAADNPPKFIHVTYTPPAAGDGGEGGEEKPLKKLALIGKGLTFDSGGYNLKAGPGSMIHLMKFDMGGAAAVLGAAKAIAAIQPQGVQVHFIIAACENMVSGGGMKPGDIITASNGKTIEVNNTDAEGRLTLADALLYAQQQGVEKIVDVATLTGACIIALGNDIAGTPLPCIAGLFTPNDELSAELEASSKACGDKVWRMPMEEAYWEGMRSKHADMLNTGGREGGSITAALFLKQNHSLAVSFAAAPLFLPSLSGLTLKQHICVHYDEAKLPRTYSLSCLLPLCLLLLPPFPVTTPSSLMPLCLLLLPPFPVTTPSSLMPLCLLLLPPFPVTTPSSLMPLCLLLLPPFPVTTPSSLMPLCLLLLPPFPATIPCRHSLPPLPPLSCLSVCCCCHHSPAPVCGGGAAMGASGHCRAGVE
ncbi:unnamed protein product [Closterium sp. Naga37s-1]|nr:unnamed protein product [Closterium sp. Naga37s-1]